MVDKFSDFVKEFVTEEDDFMEKLREVLVQVRLKRKYIHSLATLIEKSVGHKYSPQKVVELVNRYKESLDKIAEVEYLSNQGIVYVGENDNIDVDSFENVYIMYANENLSKEASSSRLYTFSSHFNRYFNICINVV